MDSLPDEYINRIERLCNALELAGVVVVLLLAFLTQIILYELPCPLCLLQRLGFFGIALGFMLNLRFSFRPSHYAVVILSALFTSFVALRQIALHIVPGTGSYGDAIFGLHLYTWSFIVAMIVMVVTALMMSLDRQYKRYAEGGNRRSNWTIHLLLGATALLVGISCILVFLQCGFKSCPENPTHYIYWPAS